jgi:uncharacterized MAPEG superfamily protein
MSEKGQTRHFDGLPITSGLPQSTDIVRVGRHVSNVQRPFPCVSPNAIAAIRSLSAGNADAIGTSSSRRLTRPRGARTGFDVSIIPVGRVRALRPTPRDIGPAFRPGAKCRSVDGGPAGAGATGVQLYFGLRVAYLALYAAGAFLLRSIVWNATTARIALVLLSLVRTMRLPSYMLTVKHQG